MKIQICLTPRINELLSRFDNQYPIKTTYKLMKLARAVAKELEFYNSKLRDYINEYSLKDESGNLQKGESDSEILIDPARLEECQQKIQELNELEVELPDITFSLEELEGANFSISDLQVFSPFIAE